MRIGLVAPPWTTVPPTGYGGTEVVVDNLARGLQAEGHEVVLFTVGASTCPVTRRHLFDVPPHPMGTSVEEAAHVMAAYDALDGVDLIHDHTVLGPLLATRSSHRDTIAGPPVVSTHHGRFGASNRRIFAEIARHAEVVAISHDQASSAPEIPFAAVIHHGIDLDTYRPGPGNGGYLLFMSRMSPDKGAATALRAAHESGLPLRIATKMREDSERDYFEHEVRPLLRADDEVLVEPPIMTRLQLLRGAAALLNPIDWPEPFGLVMAESLASGTPVLSFPRGAAPEIVEHGRTGFLCPDEQALVAAVRRLPEIDRLECRAAARARFSLPRMVADHVALYQHILGRPVRPARPGDRAAIPSGALVGSPS